MAAAVAAEVDLAVEAAASTAVAVAVAVSTVARTIIPIITLTTIHIIPIHPFGAVGIPVGATMAVAVA